MKKIKCPFCKKIINQLKSIDGSVIYGISNEGDILYASMYCSHCNKSFGVKCQITEVDDVEVKFDPAVLKKKIESINKQFEIKKCFWCGKILTKARIKIGSNFCSKKCNRALTEARLSN